MLVEAPADDDDDDDDDDDEHRFRFGITTVTLYMQTRGDRSIVCTPTRIPRVEGARARARSEQLRGRGRLRDRARGFSLSGRDPNLKHQGSQKKLPQTHSSLMEQSS